MKEASENFFIHGLVLVGGEHIHQRKRGVVREPVDGVKLEIMIAYRVTFEKPQIKQSTILYLYKDKV